MNTLIRKAHRASSSLLNLSEEIINNTLRDIAQEIVDNTDAILKANALDLDAIDPADYHYDRLMLNQARITDMSNDISKIALLPSPFGTLEERQTPSGLTIKKVSVPFGTVAVIYEARPNVTTDAAAICLKTRNAAILKGGHEAANTNAAIATCIHSALKRNGISPEVVTLMPPNRAATRAILNATGMIDLIIPRGSNNLIQYVRSHAKVPVIETGAGICHCYIHADADPEMATRIVLNAKTRRYTVCNTLDTLVVHSDILPKLYDICRPLIEHGITIHADARSFQTLSKGGYPKAMLNRANSDSWHTEYLSPQMSVKTVDNLTKAINQIQKYGSGHSETIVCENTDAAQQFMTHVDAACVYHNTPTSFTDGAQFGLGAEIGISTQKLHARGPMALRELTTYKYLISSPGIIRS